MKNKYKIKVIMKPGKGTRGSIAYGISLPKEVVENSNLLNKKYEVVIINSNEILFRGIK